MADPYKEGLFSANPYHAKREIAGRLVVILTGKLENRGLSLIVPISRAVKKNEIHELIITDEAGAGPGNTVDRIAYMGFLEISAGGVLVAGDELIYKGVVLGRIAGYDETHLPNHLNIVVYSGRRADGRELGLELESELRFKQNQPEMINVYEDKLKKMGINLPRAPRPVAAYAPAVLADKYVYTSGQIPFIDGELKYRGKVGSDLSESQGYEAAKICAVNCLSAVKELIGSLDNIERIVKVTGYVNSAEGFFKQPAVINGASEFLGEIFGEAGRHARAAVGVCELPLNAAVEVEMIVKLKG
jgi:enamine deaminase RidA (YjgF/YER057c/UK114 family)